MKTVKRKMLSTWVCFSILFIATVVIFGITVEIRRPSFGIPDTMESMWFTPHTVLMLKNFWKEGVLNSWGVGFEQPASIEFEGPHARDAYLSYPSGYLLLPHFVFRLLGTRPSLPSVMAFNMAYHFLVALVLGILLFVFLQQLRYAPSEALIFALIPVICELLLPAPIYLHLAFFFTDSEVMIFFVLYIFLEVLRDEVNTQRGAVGLALIQTFIALIGMSTDWLFGPVVFCVYVKRVFRGEMGKPLFSSTTTIPHRFISFVGRSMAFWFPIGLVLLFFAWQLFFMDRFGFLFSKLLSWSGTSEQNAPFSLAPLGMWAGHLLRGYGVVGVLLLLVSALVFGIVVVWTAPRFLRGLFGKSLPGRSLDERTSKTLALIFMLSAPCFLYGFLLRTHAGFPRHYFTALKFAVPLGTIPFVLMPILVLSCCQAPIRQDGGIQHQRHTGRRVRRCECPLRRCGVYLEQRILPAYRTPLQALYNETGLYGSKYRAHE